MCLAIPGKIETIDNLEAQQRSGTVSFAGIRKAVNLAFVADAMPGDYVIVHAGIAIARLNEAEAQQVLDMLNNDPSEH